MKIGERLRKLRVYNDFTLDEAGKRIGATKQTLYKYENGIITNIPSDKIEKLAELYNTTPSYIMGWSEELNEKEKKFIDTYYKAKASNNPAVIALASAIDKLLEIAEQENDEND